MTLTTSQLQTLKAYIDANLAGLQDEQVAMALNLPASPDYFAWKSSLLRADLYHQTSVEGTTWSWDTYKAQTQGEQGAWTQMFMGDSGPIGNLNFRQGILSIFSGSGAQTTQRNHCFAAGKRKTTVAEKLLALPVINPPANTGNNTALARGNIGNPDNLGFEGNITAANVSQANNS